MRTVSKMWLACSMVVAMFIGGCSGEQSDVDERGASADAVNGGGRGICTWTLPRTLTFSGSSIYLNYDVNEAGGFSGTIGNWRVGSPLAAANFDSSPIASIRVTYSVAGGGGRGRGFVANCATQYDQSKNVVNFQCPDAGGNRVLGIGLTINRKSSGAARADLDINVNKPNVGEVADSIDSAVEAGTRVNFSLCEPRREIKLVPQPEAGKLSGRLEAWQLGETDAGERAAETSPVKSIKAMWVDAELNDRNEVHKTLVECVTQYDKATRDIGFECEAPFTNSSEVRLSIERVSPEGRASFVWTEPNWY